MTTSPWVLVLAVAACAGTEPNPLVVAPQGERMPPDIAASCDLAARRCSRCHAIDRILRARITEPHEWRRYVHRMRLMPSSAIPPSEEPALVRCLVFRVSGTAGLTQLAEEAP